MTRSCALSSTASGWLLTSAWRLIAPVLRPLCAWSGRWLLPGLGTARAVAGGVMGHRRVSTLLRWRRSPLTIACSFIPPLGMTLFLIVLSLSVTQQPVALVVNGHGAETERMRSIIAADDDAYLLTITDARTGAADVGSNWKSPRSSPSRRISMRRCSVMPV